MRSVTPKDYRDSPRAERALARNGVSTGYRNGRAEPYTGHVPAERKAKTRNAAKAAKKARRVGRKK